jgi:Mg2+ and Co2+ transporter CorA
MNRLTVGDTESVKNFKRTIRQMMEVFLRFTHRYWFHEVSNQAIARGIYSRLSKLLGNDDLYEEVRSEVTDMNNYLDSDSARRQANTVLRLTVVTIVGLIGTIASGLLGMNLIAWAEEPMTWRVGTFLFTTGLTLLLTLITVAQSKRLADVLDAISDSRVPWKSKWTEMARAWRSKP